MLSPCYLEDPYGTHCEFLEEDYLGPPDYEDGVDVYLCREDAIFTLFEELVLGAQICRENVLRALTSLAAHCEDPSLLKRVLGITPKEVLSEYLHKSDHSLSTRGK